MVIVVAKPPHYKRLLTIKPLALIISTLGEVLELADRHDLGSCVERRAGSSPAFPTVKKTRNEGYCFEDTN